MSSIPLFKARLRNKISTACAKTKGNPNCIGYWWTDIPPWLVPMMNKRDKNWVEFIRDLPATAPGRRRYEAFLKSGGPHQDIDFLRLIARELYTDTAAIFEELDPERFKVGCRASPLHQQNFRVAPIDPYSDTLTPSIMSIEVERGMMVPWAGG